MKIMNVNVNIRDTCDSVTPVTIQHRNVTSFNHEWMR